jgi:peptidoglycan/LPS O-acetylase OafA/YrhL
MTNVMSRAAAAPSTDAVGGENLRPAYRADIDGLRAVAILSVVAYHLVPPALPGGFLGVDVFFVISGFLISTIIFRSLANDSFSFVEFYARRVRRIFPGLILVVGFSLYVGWHALLPSEFDLLGRHVVASTIFYENFRLWHEAGYFDIATSLKPLMHLWSLAIEEQFYLLFPLLLWGAWRFRLNLLALVVFIFALSFALYLRDFDRHRIAAFFSPTARFWELMAGAILAHLTLYQAETLRAVRSLGRRRCETGTAPGGWLFSLAGIALLGLVFSGLNRHLPLANLTGEVGAVLGSALLIFSGPAGLVNRLVLANRAVVFVGLISYPLYLWHWPLLSYLTIVEATYPPFYQRAIAVAIAFVLAILTYRFVELPIRHGRTYRTRSTAALVTASASLFLLGFFAHDLAPSYDEATKKIMQVWNFSGYPNSDAFFDDKEYGFPAIGRNDHDKIVFIGDSHTIQYRQTVAGLYTKSGLTPDQFPEVIFLQNIITANMKPGDALFKKIVDDSAVKTVVFSEFWALQRRSDKINYAVRCCGTGLMQMIGPQAQAALTQQQIDEDNKNLGRFVALLRQAGKSVYVVLDNPFGEEVAPRSLLDRSFFRKIKVSLVTFSKADALERDEPTRTAIRRIARDNGAEVIDPMAFLCNQATCPALAENGMPLYKDYDHLSEYALTHEVRYLDFIVEPAASETKRLRLSP